MCTRLALLLFVILAGCVNLPELPEVDPATTVLVKINGAKDEAEKDCIEEKIKELVLEKAYWEMTQTSQHMETLMIKASPVKDVKAFTDRITFGKVTAVEDRIIHVTVNGEKQAGRRECVNSPSLTKEMQRTVESRWY
jgi:hypothetical protein